MEGATTNTMEAIISAVSAFFTAAIGWMGEVVELIATEPILLLTVVVLGVAGFAIGAVKRLTRL